MCRYGIHTYKNHFACFKCRKAFSRMTTQVCPHCGSEIHAMGRDFKAPRRRNIRQWRKVKKLYRNGVRFSSCGCNGPGYRPKFLTQVDDFLENQKRSELVQDKERRFLLHLK